MCNVRSVNRCHSVTSGQVSGGGVKFGRCYVDVVCGGMYVVDTKASNKENKCILLYLGFILSW